MFTVKTSEKRSYLYLQQSKYDKKRRKPVTQSYSLGPVNKIGQIIDQLLSTAESVFIGEAIIQALFEKLGINRHLKKDLKKAGATLKQIEMLYFLISTRGIRPLSKLGSTRYLTHSLLQQKVVINHVNECYQTMGLLTDPEALFRKYSALTLAALNHQPHTTYFDTTSIFFYSDVDTFRLKGFNKDHRRGQPQIILALSCTEEWLPISYRVYPGNTADITCFKDYLALPPDKKILLVFDDGCYSFDMIQYLEEHKYRYIAGCDITRYQPIGEAKIIMLNNKRWKILEAVYQDHRVIEAYNIKNRKKGLEKLDNKISRVERFAQQVKGRTLDSKQQKIQELIVSLSLKSVFTVKQEEGRIILTKNERKLQRKRKQTKLIRIMTNLDDSSKRILARYLGRVDVERVFMYLKSPLAIRPVYHSNEKAIKAHIFIALMGYLQLTTLRYYLQTNYQVNLTLESLLEELSFATATMIEPRPGIKLTYAGKQISWLLPLLQELELPLKHSEMLLDLPNSVD